jgi:arabinose-5-phosphate isomerase
VKEINILEIAKQTLSIEIDALEALKDSLDERFEEVTQLISKSKGRLIVTGVGKSALVAQKIVATLNSTGTPAIFMHAADAIHGDLGMMRADDLALCLSKSGDTTELKVLIPFIKILGNTTIALTSNDKSYLAQHADYHLLTPISQEADPNNLAPTASSTAQIALGDALAMALLALRGFTAQDFAKFHPGGTLGKQLYLRVKDIFIKNEKPITLLEDNIQKVIIEISSKRLGITAVLDKNNTLKGVITDGDLRRMLAKYSDFTAMPASEIMNTQPKTIQQDALAVHALAIMRDFSITQLVVMEKETYVGIIHLHDLINEGLV